MAHLAARARVRLAVEMQRRRRARRRISCQRSTSSPIRFSITTSLWRGARRAASRDRAHMLLELRDEAAVLGPVTGIVHARRDLVDQHAPVRHDEHLDRQQPHIIHRRDHLAGGLDRTLGDVGRDRGGGQRLVQDAVAVAVLHRLVTADTAVRRARGDHRDLEREIDEALQHRALALHGRPGLRRIVRLADHRLPLAVIAEARGLQHRRPAQPLQRRLKLLDMGDLGPGGGLDAHLVQEGLLQGAVLGDLQGVAAGTDGDQAGEKIHRLDRDILELQRHHVDGGGEGLQRLTVVPSGGGVRGDVARRAAFRRLEDMAAIAEPRGVQRQHAPQLPAAQHADHGAGRDHARGLVEHRGVTFRLRRPERRRRRRSDARGRRPARRPRPGRPAPGRRPPATRR
jgi:hypothetical protein